MCCQCRIKTKSDQSTTTNQQNCSGISRIGFGSGSAKMHDSATPTATDSRQIVRRSNWLLLLTRRRKKSSSTIKRNDRNEESDEITTTASAASSSSSSASPSAGRKSTFLYAFNKMLKIRTKTTNSISTSKSNVVDDNAVAASTTTASAHGSTGHSANASNSSFAVTVHRTAIAATNNTLQPAPSHSSAEPVNFTIGSPAVAIHSDQMSSSNIYCTSVPEGVIQHSIASNQSAANWLHSLSPAEALVYRARIAMTPMAWYRGAMTRERAQQKLQAQPNGSFLVRDSQTTGCHFTLSFRSAGITLHYRIECQNGFWVIESYRNVSLVGLIEHAQQLSHDQILCYVKPSSQLQQPFPVRLTHAISKRSEVPSLQHICRYVIRRHLLDDGDVRTGELDDWLPERLQAFVRHNAFLGKHIGYFET